ncbi:MAG: RNA-binding domain-containing protein, partial [Candidatus Natronoplasma sp.]
MPGHLSREKSWRRHPKGGRLVTFHYIEFKAFCHATESLDRVEISVENLAGRELEMDISDAEGYYGNPIKILES